MASLSLHPSLVPKASDLPLSERIICARREEGRGTAGEGGGWREYRFPGRALKTCLSTKGRGKAREEKRQACRNNLKLPITNYLF